MSTTELPDEAVDVEEDDPVEHAALLDIGKVEAACKARVERAQAKGRKDVETMLSSWTLDLIANHKQAVSDALAAESDVRYADYERRNVGDIAKKNSLAGLVRDGKLDA